VVGFRGLAWVVEVRGEQIDELGPKLGWVVVEEQFAGGAVVDGQYGSGESFRASQRSSLPRSRTRARPHACADANRHDGDECNRFIWGEQRLPKSLRSGLASLQQRQRVCAGSTEGAPRGIRRSAPSCLEGHALRPP
jgi:hypothetical protein